MKLKWYVPVFQFLVVYAPLVHICYMVYVSWLFFVFIYVLIVFWSSHLLMML